MPSTDPDGEPTLEGAGLTRITIVHLDTRQHQRTEVLIMSVAAKDEELARMRARAVG